MQWSFNQDTDCDVDAPEAWDIETGNEDVIIAVLDTGVEINHSDISDNIWINSDEIGDNGIDDDNNGFVDDVNGWNFAYGGINDVWDNQGHGTHCAGVIGAVGNNNKGVAGLCWNCKIMPVRVLPDGPMPIHILAEGVFYAIENGARVISMSLGIYGYSRYLEDLFYYADSKGVICIASAGNDDTYEVQYPSGYEEVISVAATDQNDERAFFSNYGSSVDIAAPGVEIYSLDNYNSSVSYTHLTLPTN